jgi:predicted MPP superfamily phosphohydrolase
MRIVTLADLHLDIWAEARMNPFEFADSEILKDVSHCFVLGDLGNKGAKNWTRYLGRVQDHMPNAEIFVIPGNHDYYGERIDREDKLEEAATAAGARFVQMKPVLLEDIRFLPCTFWTDFKLHGEAHQFAAQYDAERQMNDYRKIRVEREGYRRLSPNHTATIHAAHRAWLKGNLEQEFDGKTVILTHHVPHPKLSLDPEKSISAAYASDMSRMIDQFQPEAWLCGHSHSYNAVQLGETLVQNVSLGYPWEVKQENLAELWQDLLTDLRERLSSRDMGLDLPGFE